MTTALDAIKRLFREGRRSEAIAACDAHCRQHPTDLAARKLGATMRAMVGDHAGARSQLRALRDAGLADADVLFNLAASERELNDLPAAERAFAAFTTAHPNDAAGWAGLAECLHQLGRADEGLRAADRAVALDAGSLQGWTNRGHCLQRLGRHDEAIAAYERANRIQPTVEAWFDTARCLLARDRPRDALDAYAQAIRLAPDLARLRIERGDLLQRLGRLQDAVADYREALRVAPADDEILKKATMCLLQAGQGEQAVALCRELLRRDPSLVNARLGAEWVLSQLVPLWHVPMMNEAERNRAYHDGLAKVVRNDRTVFEIGTGSGLLAMMAARLGAARVVTCEAVPLVAETARRIVADNRLQDRVTVLAKPSQAVQPGTDLPAPADVLVHEVFSSELLGEHVLAAIEDAKARLLKPGGIVLPRAASLVIALVGGDALGGYLHAGEAFGFDLRAFNAVRPRKVPIHREDLAPELMSEPVEAFRFDFAGAATFPAERRTLRLPVTAGGTCHGVIQWIRIDVADGVMYENHPARPRRVANWQPTVYAFDAPVRLPTGTVVTVAAMHDRTRPWFERVPDGGGPER